jgi:hypothetical protein
MKKVFFISLFILRIVSYSQNTANEDIIVNGISMHERNGLAADISVNDYVNGWTYLNETEIDYLLFKNVSEYKSGYKQIQAWIKWIPKKDKLAQFRKSMSSYSDELTKQKILNSAKSVVVKVIYDCNNSKSGLKVMIIYDTDGQSITNLDYDISMDEVVPDTVGETEFNILSGARLPKDVSCLLIPAVFNRIPQKLH